MTRASNQVALVTCAPIGIGAAVAKRLAADGAHAIIDYARGEAQARVPAEIGGAPARQADIAITSVAPADGAWITGETLRVGGGLKP